MDTKQMLARQEVIELINMGRKCLSLLDNIESMCLWFTMGYNHAKNNEITDREFFELMTLEERLLYAIFKD